MKKLLLNAFRPSFYFIWFFVCLLFLFTFLGLFINFMESLFICIVLLLVNVLFFIFWRRYYRFSLSDIYTEIHQTTQHTISSVIRFMRVILYITNVLAGAIPFVFTMIVAVAFLYMFDWSFLQGGITSYSRFCSPSYTERNGCYSLPPTTYYPNKKAQTVIYKTEYSIETLQKCTVIDRRNWECKYDDESAVFGFIKGNFHSTTLWSYTISSEEILEYDKQEEYIPRFIWILEDFYII